MGFEEGQGIIEAVMYGRYEEALGVPPFEDRSVVNRRHIQLLARYRPYPDVVESLNKAKNAIINEPRAQAGRRFFAQGRDAEALRALEEEATRKPTAEDFHLIGQILTKLNRNHDAVAKFEKAVELRGAAIDYAGLGNAYTRIDEHEQARACLERALKMRGHAVDYQSLGRVYYQLGRYIDAHRMLGEAVKRDHTTDYRLLKRCRSLAFRQRIKHWLNGR